MSNYYNRQWRLPNAWNGTESNVNKQSNYSMDFDGSNDTINIGTSLNSVLNGYSSSFTISCWINASDSSNRKGIISNYTGIGTYLDLINQSSTTFKLQGGYHTTSASSGFVLRQNNTNLNINNWYNIVLVVSSGGASGSVDIYVNGSLDNGIQYHNTTQSYTNTNNLYISTNLGYQGNFFNGKIDAVAIFDYPLSSSQVTTLYGSSSTGIGNPMSLSPAPVAYYPLGDQDAFNGSNYLVPNSSLKDYVFNQNGNQLVTITGNSTTQPTGDYSLSIWVKIVGSATYSGILNATTNNNANGVGFLYKYSTGQFEFYQGAFANILIFTGSTNTWQNIIISYNNTTGDLIAYLNGQQADSNTITPSGVSWVVDWQLNNYRQSASPLYGQNEFSNFQIFDTALSASDAETLYNNGSPLTSMSGFTSLQGWWKLDASATYDSSTTTWTIPDDSTNSNDGTSSGMTQANLVQSDLSFTSGYSPYAFDFDSASSQRIDVGTINLASNWSISIWVNWTWIYASRSAFGGSNGLLQYSPQTSSSGGLMMYPDDTTNNYFNVTPAINDGKWHNVVFSYDNSTTTLNTYTDGYLSDSRVNTASATNFKYIGFAHFYWLGKLSNCSVWNTNLSAAQVTEIYNEGVPSNLNNHSAYSNLTNWWQLGSNSSFNTNWTVLDEKGTNNGTSANMTEDDIVDGVGSYANGTSSGMGGDEVVGDAPYSTANSLSVNMDVLDRTDDTPA